MITLRQAVRASGTTAFEPEASGSRLSVLSIESAGGPVLDETGALLVAVWPELGPEPVPRVALWRPTPHLLAELARLDAVFPLRRHDLVVTPSRVVPRRVRLASAAYRSTSDAALAARRAMESGAAALGWSFPALP